MPQRGNQLSKGNPATLTYINFSLKKAVVKRVKDLRGRL